METAGETGRPNTPHKAMTLSFSLPQVVPAVAAFPDRHSLLHLPNPFIVPGGRFRETYYWYITPLISHFSPYNHILPVDRDTYWIVEGLLLCGMNDTARGMIENLAYMVDV